MTRSLAALALALALPACGAANITDDPDRTLTAAERATPPARTSDDELDGPTAPRGSASRPIGEGAGYDDGDDESGGDERR
jgi:hypothetical protein